jgi:CRISPR-associated protein Csb2
VALTITVRLRHGRYDAAFPADKPEWPPHPARLFCALLASVEHDPRADGYAAELAALRWLEQAGPPVVWAAPPDAVEYATHHGYAVTNATEAKSGSTLWPGRTNSLRVRHGVLPNDDQVAFTWPETNPDDAVLWRLHRLARRVPYLGRSTSWVEVAVHDESVPFPEPATESAGRSRVAYRPVLLGTPGAIDLRVPYPGYTDQLLAAYELGERAWSAATMVAYRYDGAVDESRSPETSVIAGPYRELVVFPIARGTVPISGQRLLNVTEALRRAVLSRVADPVPPQVSGHGADGRPHVAYLGLLDVGHRYADGHLLGLAAAVPADLATAERRALLRGLYGADGNSPMRELRCGHDGVLHLGDPFEPAPVWGLQPERWVGPGQGAHRWLTATPVMLDRYPKRRPPGELVAEALVTAGYPRPESVTVLEAPLVTGAPHRPARGTVSPSRAGRPVLHCRVEFAAPVRGPVLAGALRYLGYGLFVPEVTHVG